MGDMMSGVTTAAWGRSLQRDAEAEYLVSGQESGVKLKRFCHCNVQTRSKFHDLCLAHRPTLTRQDKIVLSCQCRRCELGVRFFERLQSGGSPPGIRR